MKTRIGFISNSSSSSFVCYGRTLSISDLKEIAKVGADILKGIDIDSSSLRDWEKDYIRNIDYGRSVTNTISVLNHLYGNIVFNNTSDTEDQYFLGKGVDFNDCDDNVIESFSQEELKDTEKRIRDFEKTMNLPEGEIKLFYGNNYW